MKKQMWNWKIEDRRTEGRQSLAVYVYPYHLTSAQANQLRVLTQSWTWVRSWLRIQQKRQLAVCLSSEVAFEQEERLKENEVRRKTRLRCWAKAQNPSNPRRDHSARCQAGKDGVGVYQCENR